MCIRDRFINHLLVVAAYFQIIPMSLGSVLLLLNQFHLVLVRLEAFNHPFRLPFPDFLLIPSLFAPR